MRAILYSARLEMTLFTPNLKRKRGNDLPSSLTLRVSVKLSRAIPILRTARSALQHRYAKARCTRAEQ